METILTITQSDIDPGFVMPENATWYERYAARAVLTDASGRIALLHAAKRDYYKLPGGGVEPGEDMALALARELLEEVGAEADVVGTVGRVEEWRSFDGQNMHQISDAYLAKVTGEIGTPDFTEKELAEGFSVVWAEGVEQAVSLVVSALDSPYPEVKFMALRDSTILKASSGTEI